MAIWTCFLLKIKNFFAFCTLSTSLAEKKSKEKHKRRRKETDSFEELSKDDYFAKNNEFATWLKEERGIYFSELSSDAARELFSGFVKEWNSGKLQPVYYEGIASGPRTAHNWRIKHEK
ncbi:splicing factor, arginine serine-rich 12 [Musa troglodytarum]|uniref:Splicing factor, arginine serine-rich 12 n=1 Tax=Musa troglodytarum TaxID=320322 RepID=A0A9E7EDE7_9LILI|nr:splicing factor, arginine serine-rich 12 [Musa troglodytarum]